MTHEKDPFQFDDIPEFALRPAKGAEDDQSPYMQGGKNSPFDATAYEKVFHVPAEETTSESIAGAGQTMRPEDAAAEMAARSDSASVENVEEILAAGIGVPEATATQPEEGAEDETQETMAELAAEETVAEVGDELQQTAADADDGEDIQQVAAEEGAMETIADADPQEDEGEAALVAAPDESDEDAMPVRAPHPDSEGEAAPVMKPGTVPKKQPTKLVPLVGTLMSSKLKLVDIKQKPQVRIFLEEDVLVPDVKPDLANILTMDGKIKLSEKVIHIGQADNNSVKITGDLILSTLYIPETASSGESMIPIESRIPFKIETEMNTVAHSDLAIAPVLESIDYTVVNERKFKIKAAITLGLREYSNVDIEIFEGIRDEEVQMLKEKINLTDVALRKTEAMELKEELPLKDTLPEIQKILKYDVNVVENHKQITKEKAVINASVYCNVMYLGNDSSVQEASAEEDSGTKDTAVPVLYQGKTEFTQFIRLDGDDNPAGQNPAGSRVNFTISSLNLTAKEDGNGKKNIFDLGLNVDTSLELYKNLEKEVVTDVYHHLKDIQFDTDEIGLMSLRGSGVAEISVREIVNIPEKFGNVEKIVYISGSVSEKSSVIDQGKNIIEGIVSIDLIGVAGDEKQTPHSFRQEIPFRSAMEIPGISPEMSANNDIMLKELWFDKINNRQIEVNAGILVNTTVSNTEKHQLVKNITFLEQENPQERPANPGIILYITRDGDTIWKIAKKYRTTINEIRKINDLEPGKEIKQGMKLLIVAKNH